MASTTNVTIKLFIDAKSQKVIFAEDGKDFVDFLFNLLALPLGTVTRLLTKDSMVGSISNIYSSMETIGKSYLITPELTKEALLQPKIFSGSRTQVPLLPDYASISRKLYFCNNINNCHYYVTDDPNMTCPGCNTKMCLELVHVTSSGNRYYYISEDGFVKGLIVSYMIMDDLVIEPISSITTLMKNFNIKNFGEHEEKVVHLDMAQGVQLLKASLQ